MSLLVSVTLKHFTVIVSDGLKVRVENGALVKTDEGSCKYWTVGNGDIAMGSTGSALMSELISDFSIKLAEQHRDNPELFSILAKAVPEELLRLNKLFPMSIEYLDGAESINLGGTNLLMVGYDASQQRIRSLFWGYQGIKSDDLTPHDCANEIQAAGCGKAVALVMEKLDVTDGLGGPGPWDVESSVKNVIQQAAEAFPKFVGGTIYSHVISTPDLKSIYEEIKRDRQNS